MHILKEFYHPEGFVPSGKTLERAAVRAIIRRGDCLLLVYSPVNGDYKFPGGGVEPGESHADTLGREIAEECGMRLLRLDGELGCVVEYIRPQEPEYGVFKMTSHYYFCRVEDGPGRLRLDEYEQELGFCPAWIKPTEALRANRVVLQAALTVAPAPRWTRRDTFILERLVGLL